MTTTTDTDLVTDTRAGNMDALAELYRRHSSRATNYAMTLTHNLPDAEDLVAESFLRMWDSIRAGRTPLRPYSYLCQSIHNRFIDQAERAAKYDARGAGGFDNFGDLANCTYDLAVNVVEHDALAQAFTALCPTQRVVLWETVIEGYPSSAARAATANAGAQLAYRARTALREAYLQASA